jgi:hypothetical protein
MVLFAVDVFCVCSFGSKAKKCFFVVCSLNPYAVYYASNISDYQGLDEVDVTGKSKLFISALMHINTWK